jgi:putative ABC transport system substrate-binding protein
LQIEIALAGKEQELESAFATLAQNRAAALLVTADPFFDTRRDRIIALAAQFRLPAIYQFRDYAVSIYDSESNSRTVVDIPRSD